MGKVVGIFFLASHKETYRANNLFCYIFFLFPFQDGYISSEQAVLLQSQLLTLLAELRPNAVALVDAFDFPDAVLDSALGRWDGNVYEALYDYSLRSKLNEKQVS